MRYFAKVKFVGTDFFGFQVQPDKRTVQGELSRALQETFSSPVRITGCSRTDAGVHANELCITVDTEGAAIPPEKLPLAVSRFLPEDLSLIYAKECDDKFHVRHDVKYKEYVYRIKNSRIRDPFEVNRSWFLPRPIDESALAKMNEAASYLVGCHDFRAFMAEGSDVTDTTRNVTELCVERSGDIITVRVCADGFLYNMVRIIVGTLVEVAYGRFTPKDVFEILNSGKRVNAGMTAPPGGLYLNRVVY